MSNGDDLIEMRCLVTATAGYADKREDVDYVAH